MLLENGLVVIGENSDKERATVFKYANKKFNIVHSINGGTISEKYLQVN